MRCIFCLVPGGLNPIHIDLQSAYRTFLTEKSIDSLPTSFWVAFSRPPVSRSGPLIAIPGKIGTPSRSLFALVLPGTGQIRNLSPHTH
jgi:hypothetical protein